MLCLAEKALHQPILQQSRKTALLVHQNDSMLRHYRLAKQMRLFELQDSVSTLTSFIFISYSNLLHHTQHTIARKGGYVPGKIFHHKRNVHRTIHLELDLDSLNQEPTVHQEHIVVFFHNPPYKKLAWARLQALLYLIEYLCIFHWHRRY